MNIGIDLMGGDIPPTELFQALLFAAQELPPSVTLTALVTPDLAKQIEQRYWPFGFAAQTATIKLLTAPEYIHMDDDPLLVLRRKKQSTMHIAFQLLRQQQLQALISVANTGALVAGSALMLPRLPGITRPALLVTLPTEEKSITLIDVGGNLATKPEHLLQFALIGSAFQMAVQKPAEVTVGLLNIGKETGKGGEQRKLAFQLLNQKLQGQLHFIGNVEPHEVFQGHVDVTVTDGFSGNIFLKSAEGTAAYILRHLFHTLKADEHPLHPAIQQLYQQFNSVDSPGALLCGVDRLVIKCHGCSTPRSLLHGIQRAYFALKHSLLDSVKHHLAINLAQINS